MRLKATYSAILFTAATSVAFAHGGGGGAAPTERKSMSIVRPPIEKQSDDNSIRGKIIHQESVANFELTVKLVDAKESVPDGGSHNLLVNIKRDGRSQYNLAVMAEVDYLNGEKESKSMMELGDWYLAGYNLGQKECLIELSFKTTDGVLHSSSINYP